jgi:ribosomal-protein-alanine N-acetyltransferase
MSDLHVRWMIARDLAEVLGIELRAFQFPWSEDEFVRCLRQRNCIGMIAEERPSECVAGYVIYELHKDRLHVLNVAVAESQRRLGVGRALLERLIGKLTPNRYSRIVLEVRETNLAGQLFFKKLGFRAVSVKKGFYEETDEDAIVFQYRYRSTTPIVAEAATDEADPCGR